MTKAATRAGGDPAGKAMFIDVEVAPEVAADPELAEKLVGVCPVDIFAKGEDGTLEILESHLDECVLCDLCIEAAPEGTVKIRRLYE